MSAESDALAEARVSLESAVRLGGALQLEGQPRVQAELKGVQDIVTEVDRRCEREIRSLLARRHPTSAVLGEEGGGPAAGPPEPLAWLWILDPLDGTKNYVHGSTRYGCALALRIGGRVELAGIYLPAVDELFLAQRGAGATLNGEPLAVSSVAGLDRALVASAFTVRNRYQPRHFARLEELAQATQGLRAGGCASVDLCDVARGRLEAYLEEGLAPWDSAAGGLIVTEAGGRVTDFRGRPHDPFEPELLASNGLVADALVTLLGRVPEPA